MNTNPTRKPSILDTLKVEKSPLRIVCFGDSITGVYYHTGGRRAYSHMIELALRQVDPMIQIDIINAGVSGNTTIEGLARIEEDVLTYSPHLVTIMFGMNDVVRVPIDAYRDNIKTIVDLCRKTGAEIVLCTPNSVYPEDENRPVEKLAEYAQVIREISYESTTPLADCWAAYEDIRRRDERSWQLLMSETIHPNMNGHKVIAETIACSISGQLVSLREEPSLTPAIPKTIEAASVGNTIRIIAMTPFEKIIASAIEILLPSHSTDITSWSCEGKSLEQVEADARSIVGRERLAAHPENDPPHLVFIAIPPDLRGDVDENFIRSYSWMLNWSQSFGLAEWDCVAVLPSVLKPLESDNEKETENLTREIVRGQDIGMIERQPGDDRSATILVSEWLKRQLSTLSKLQ